LIHFYKRFLKMADTEVLLKQIEDQKAEIEKLQKKIEDQQAEIEKLRNGQIEYLEKQIEEQKDRIEQLRTDETVDQQKEANDSGEELGVDQTNASEKVEEPANATIKVKKPIEVTEEVLKQIREDLELPEDESTPLIDLVKRKYNLDGEEVQVPLVTAVEKGLEDAVKYLLLLGECPNKKDKLGNAPLHYAVWAENLKIVELLLNANTPIDLDAIDNNMSTALHTAITCNHTEIAKALIEHGADSSITDCYERTAILLAIREYQHEILDTMLKYCNDINKHAYNGMSALSVASLNNNMTAVQLLLRAGIDTSTVDNEGRSALHHAADDEHKEHILEALLEHGIDANIKNEKGRTALHTTAWERLPKSMKLLLQHGADPNAINNLGETALHDAAWRNFADGIRILVEHGAEVDVKNEKGETPLHQAVDYREAINALIRAGANNLRDKQGKTPAMKARENGMDGLAELIRNSF